MRLLIDASFWILFTIIGLNVVTSLILDGFRQLKAGKTFTSYPVFNFRPFVFVAHIIDYNLQVNFKQRNLFRLKENGHWKIWRLFVLFVVLQKTISQGESWNTQSDIAPCLYSANQGSITGKLVKWKTCIGNKIFSTIIFIKYIRLLIPNYISIFQQRNFLEHSRWTRT